MSNSSKASIIFLIVLVLVAGYFYHNIKSLNEEIAAVQIVVGNVERELSAFEGLRPDTLMISYLRDRRNHLDNWIFLNGKFFLASDNSMITWPYLQNITNRFEPNFQFNFAVVPREEGLFNYTISGQGSIHHLYAFISHIERLGALYTIENLVLSQNYQESETGPINVINYNITIRPWIDAAIGKRLEDEALRRVQYSPLLRDPMLPAIYPPMENPSQDQFMAYEDLQFVSFSGGQAFFIYNNTVVTLRPMQRVAYGYFSNVDERNNRAVFRINKTGLYETVYQELRGN